MCIWDVGLIRKAAFSVPMRMEAGGLERSSIATELVATAATTDNNSRGLLPLAVRYDRCLTFFFAHSPVDPTSNNTRSP